MAQGETHCGRHGHPCLSANFSISCNRLATTGGRTPACREKLIETKSPREPRELSAVKQPHLVLRRERLRLPGDLARGHIDELVRFPLAAGGMQLAQRLDPGALRLPAP